jgi:hypothetical protein
MNQIRMIQTKQLLALGAAEALERHFAGVLEWLAEAEIDGPTAAKIKATIKRYAHTVAAVEFDLTPEHASAFAARCVGEKRKGTKAA